MKNFDFLFWAYNVIWAGIAGYMLFIFLRARKLEQKVAALEKEAGER